MAVGDWPFYPAVYPVSRDTPFRATGDVSWEVWDGEFSRLSSPITGANRRAAFDAAQGVSALVLHLGIVESTLGRTQPQPGAHNNWLGLRVLTSLDFMAFASAADCVREVIRRWTDSTYKNGVYGPRDLSLAGMYFKYSPPDENDTDGLIRQAVERINRWREGASSGGINWSPLPYPAMLDMIVPKPGENAGFTRTSFRGPRTVGSCNHITDGDPAGDELAFYHGFFATGGERAWDALVDTVIARDGRIGLFNDWRDPNRGGTRAGWANGTTDGLEGDGVAFYRKFPAVNDVLVSKEHVARAGQAITDATLASSIALSAAVAQDAKCRYDTYPTHQTHGVVIEQQHRNFAPKSCPAEPFIGTVYPVLVREVKALLTKHQTGSSNPGTPPPPPPPGGPDYPPPFGLAEMEFFFGTLTRYDGQTFGFDPNGPISLLWLHRASREMVFPEAESWVQIGNRDIVTWEGGWTAVRHRANDPKDDWVWIDEAAKAVID